MLSGVSGKGQFGEKSIVHQAIHYISCAQLCPVNFTPPKIVMIFINGITRELKAELCELGVHVQGTVMDVDPSIAQQLQFDTAFDREFDESSSFDDLLYDSEDEGEGEMLSASNFLHNQMLPSVGESKSSNMNPADPSIVRNSGQSASECPYSGRDKVTSTTMTSDGQVNNDSLLIGSSNISPAGYEPQLGDNKGEKNEEANVDSYQFAADVFSTQPSIQRCNLDITALVCLVSNVCHGHNHYEFQEDVLTQQAAEERSQPMNPELQSFLKGSRLNRYMSGYLVDKECLISF